MDQPIQTQISWPEVAPLGSAVAPPRAQSPSSSWAVQPPLIEVQPPELSLRALAGGAIALDRRWHYLEAQSLSSARRCNRSSQEVQPPDPEISEIDSFELQI